MNCSKAEHSGAGREAAMEIVDYYSGIKQYPESKELRYTIAAAPAINPPLARDPAIDTYWI